jgi:hypothetical protein
MVWRTRQPFLFDLVKLIILDWRGRHPFTQSL